MKNKKLKFPWGFLTIALFLALWEIVARMEIVPSSFFPPFSSVAAQFIELTGNGVLQENLASSFLRVLAGFSLGAVAGILAGILMGWFKTLDRALGPLVSLLYPIPALGWLPLLMLWIGINETLPITIIFLCSFFPITYNTITGIKTVKKDYVQVARTLGAGELKILATVVLPLALPNIFTGLRLEAGMAWRVIIAAEMIAIPTGIGSLMIRAENLIRVDIIMVSLIILAVMSYAFERFFRFLENRLTGRWQEDRLSTNA